MLRTLGPKEVPLGYWVSAGVWLNYVLALAGLALAVHFVVSGL